MIAYVMYVMMKVEMIRDHVPLLLLNRMDGGGENQYPDVFGGCRACASKSNNFAYLPARHTGSYTQN